MKPLLTLLLLAVTALPSVAREFPEAELVIVDKSERALYLVRDGEVMKRFRIALGLRPNGHKEYEGDFRTPEGRYMLDLRNPDSEFFLSIRISYPNSRDLARASARGVDPGGQIMIHGQPNEPTRSEAYYRTQDWTNGCIAVSNSDMIDIWLMTGEQTPIEIRP